MAFPEVTTAALLSAPLVALLVLFGHMATSAPTELCLDNCICYTDDQKLNNLNCTSFQPILQAASSLLSDFSHIDVLNIRDVSDGSSDLLIDGLFGVFSNVKYANLINASISKIYPNAFKGLKRLEELDLSFNKIHKFSTETFHETPKLKLLDLSNNPLSLLPGIFLTSRSLEDLIVNSCNLTRIPAGAFQGLPNLRSIDLYNNQIQSFNTRSFPRNLKHLYLAKNNLTNIPTTAITTLKKLTSLDISDNPVNCTCSLIGFQDWFSSRGIIFENDVVCNHPVQYRGHSWTKVSETDVCLDKENNLLSKESEDSADNACLNEMCEKTTMRPEERYFYNYQADQPERPSEEPQKESSETEATVTNGYPLETETKPEDNPEDSIDPADGEHTEKPDSSVNNSNKIHALYEDNSPDSNEVTTKNADSESDTDHDSTNKAIYEPNDATEPTLNRANTEEKTTIAASISETEPSIVASSVEEETHPVITEMTTTESAINNNLATNPTPIETTTPTPTPTTTEALVITDPSPVTDTTPPTTTTTTTTTIITTTVESVTETSTAPASNTVETSSVTPEVSSTPLDTTSSEPISSTEASTAKSVNVLETTTLPMQIEEKETKTEAMPVEQSTTSTSTNVETTTPVVPINVIAVAPKDELVENKTVVAVLASTSDTEVKQSAQAEKNGAKVETMGTFIVLGGIIIILLLLILYANTRKSPRKTNKKPLGETDGNMTELQDMTTLLPSVTVTNGHQTTRYPNEEPSATAKLLQPNDHADFNGTAHPPDAEQRNPTEQTNETSDKSTLPRTNSPMLLEFTKAKVVVLPDSLPRTPIYIQKQS